MATASNDAPGTRLELDFNDNPAQEAFVCDKNKETGYIGGVGSGKTVAGIMRSARHIFEWNPGEQGAIVAPTVPMMRNVIVPEMQRWGLLGDDRIEYRRSENVIIYPNGSRVILESANNDRKIERLRGLNLAWDWLDEPAEHEHRTYRILGDRLRTGQYRNQFITGTPKGFNWVYDEFADLDPVHRESVADGELIRDDYTTTIYGVSTATNQANPEDYIESRERQHTGQSYQQEIQGKFVQFEGLIYPWFDEANIVDSPPETYDEVVYGVDWGHNNPSTILTLVRDGETWYAVQEWYERRRTVNDHSRELQDMQERWGPGVIYCDPSEPANIDQFQRDGLNAKKAENDVTPGIQHVSSMREQLRVVESCQNLRNEFSQYQYKGDDDDRPEKVNDHLMDALRYALFSHDHTNAAQTDYFRVDLT